MTHPNSGTAPSDPGWYILLQPDGHCLITEIQPPAPVPEATETWGPFSSQGEAIARRVGLIRSGKCRPV